MSHTAADLGRPRRAAPVMDRAQAFRDAARHSVRVRRLRRGIVWARSGSWPRSPAGRCLRPAGFLPGGITINQATLNGTRVMMDLPKLNGFRRDGRPYEVRARSGVQDIRTPKIIELNEIDATIQTADGSSIRVLSPRACSQRRGPDALDGGSAGDGTASRERTATTCDADGRHGLQEGRRDKRRSGRPHTDERLRVRHSLSIQGHGAVVSFTGNVKIEPLLRTAAWRITGGRGRQAGMRNFFACGGRSPLSVAAVLGLAFACALQQPALAQRTGSPILPGGNSRAPIQIDASKLDFFDKEQRLVYSGGVFAKQGDATLKATTLTIFFSKERRKARKDSQFR